jgi:TP901 family phage tail tape measure protein
MPNIGTLDTTLNIDFRKAEAQYRRFQSQVNRNFGRVNPFSQMAGGARDFDKAIGSATNRVVAFGAAAVVFNTLSRSVTTFVSSMVEVDKSLAEINVNLNQSSKGIKEFGAELFNVARQTGQTFKTAAEAATELARQGLTAEETLKRLKDALILSRTTGMSAADSVSTLTAALNSFNQEALTSTEVVNKFAAVDTKFAVSSRDLADAVSRVGSTAQAAGVGINELIGLVTSLQQTTARGGATIGNGLKTIFTRIQAAPETISALESVGVAIKDTSGNLRGAIDILRDYGRARERVGEAERAALDRTVAGTFQINILKAALSDLSKGYSVYDRALQTSSNATDEAIRKNEQLNQSLASLFNSAAVSAKQLVDAVGNQGIGPLLGNILKAIEGARSYLSGDAGDKMGEALGSGILQGLTNVLTGPAMLGLIALVGGVLKRVLLTFKEEAKTLFQANSAVTARAKIQERILQLSRAANASEAAGLATATSVARQKEILLGIQARLNRELLIGTELQNAFLVPGPLNRGFRSSPQLGRGFVGNFADPLKSAISREVAAGVPPSSIYIDKDPRVATAGNPMGVLVANRRDEPLGGFQGVDRVIASGGNPKITGKVQNFALTGRDLPFVPRKTIAELNKVLEIAESQTNLGGFYAELSKATDVALAGKLGKRGSENLFKEIGRLTDERLKLEKQIEIGRYKGAKRSKEFAEQETRLVELRSKLQKSTERVLQKQAQRAAGLNQYSESIGPMRQLARGSTMYPGPIGPKAPLRVSLEQIRASRALAETSSFREYQESVISGDVANPVAAAQVAAARQGGIVQATDTRRSILAGDAPRRQRLRLSLEQRRSLREAGQVDAAQAAERRRNLAFGGAFLFPFAGGFVEPTFKNLGINTGGGTLGGQISGGLQGASQGAALGVFGPIAGGIGAAVGAFIGAVSKSSKSLEEFNEEIDKGVIAQQANVDAISQFVSNRSQLAEGGLRPDAQARLQRQQAEILQRVDPQFRGQLQQQGLTDQQIKDIIDAASEAAARASQIGEAAKTGAAINEKSFLEKADTLFNKVLGRVPSTILFGGDVGGFTKQARLFTENPFEGVNRARELGGQLRPLINEQNVKGLDQGVISRIIGGRTRDNDLERLSMMYKRLGSDIEITADRSIEFAEALNVAKKQFKEVSQTVENLKKGALSGGLPSKSFLSAPNTDIFRQAALTGRQPFTGQTQRGRATFEMFNELERLGAVEGDIISGNPLFKRSKAITQTGNAADALISFLSGAGYNTSQLKSPKGDPRMDSILRVLTLASRSGATFAGEAKELLPIAERLKATLTQGGVRPFPEQIPGTTGVVPGADYGAFNKITKRAALRYDAAGRPILTQVPSAPAAGRGGSVSQETLNKLPGVPSGEYDEAKRNADIDSYLKIANDAKVAAEAAAQALQQTLNIMVTVQGAGSPETLDAIKVAVQSLFNNQAAMAGKPMPPTVAVPEMKLPAAAMIRTR